MERTWWQKHTTIIHIIITSTWCSHSTFNGNNLSVYKIKACVTHPLTRMFFQKKKNIFLQYCFIYISIQWRVEVNLLSTSLCEMKTWKQEKKTERVLFHKYYWNFSWDTLKIIDLKSISTYVFIASINVKLIVNISYNFMQTLFCLCFWLWLWLCLCKTRQHLIMISN